MATDILVSMKIPFLPSGGYLVFHQWVPLNNKDDALLTNRDNMTVKLWCDLNCCPQLREADLPIINRLISIVVDKVYIDLEIQGISDELAGFIYEEKERRGLGLEKNPDERYKRLRREYSELGQQVLQAALDAFNRLISYARIKGQYWLEPRSIDFNRMTSDFIEFDAKVKTEGREWIPWFPALSSLIKLRSEDPKRFITQEDWSEVSKFLKEKSRPDLVLELLANSEALASKGYRRNAIIEAVTALEIAISNFAESPKIDKLIETKLVNRIDTAHLKPQIEHLGLSGTVRYLLPLLFEERILLTELINQCQSAINIRGNIVHNKQRDVKEETLLPLLKAIREVCAILAQFTGN